ncbi:MAG: hypothetical protein JWN44_697 [Myxococcales bacterium]|nr:hypothetical protein [Myxococcales bacterium]
MRPRLAPSLFVRTYVGERGREWVLVTARTRVRIDALTRALLELSDGNRTLERIARAAGAHHAGALEAADVERLLAPLIAAGFVIDAGAPPLLAPSMEMGDAGGARAVLERIELEPGPLRLVLAAGVGIDCDGRGGCCGLYDRIGLSAAEAARIAECYAEEHTPGGLYVASAVVQERADEDGIGLAVVDGHCTLLEDDGRCGIHARAGLQAKPDSCRFYPLRDVVCGDELHVGLAVECRCVIDFAGAAPGPLRALAEELVARRIANGVVEAVPLEVALCETRRVPRGEYLRWRGDAGTRLRGEGAGGEGAGGDGRRDARAWALAEAQALGAVARPLPVDELVEWLAREVADTAAVYSPRDLQRQIFAWAHRAAQRLRDDAASSLTPVAGEQLLAEQLLHAHGFLRAPSLAAGLVSFALRVSLARSGAALPLPPALLPLSAAEYLARTHSFGHVG